MVHHHHQHQKKPFDHSQRKCLSISHFVALFVRSFDEPRGWETAEVISKNTHRQKQTMDDDKPKSTHLPLDVDRTCKDSAIPSMTSNIGRSVILDLSCLSTTKTFQVEHDQRLSRPRCIYIIARTQVKAALAHASSRMEPHLHRDNSRDEHEKHSKQR
jgi:hypothetical protein